ncbi:energy-coupling factor transporter transmembrane component T [Sporanaerobacter sp. PP17-6a]|uniref:energy-coupling factor transporter transmembrane component T n=1 Tax=Sporanaerobacter sp. PP17-6a TaxID=1891289 RepID=UPI00089FC7B3|nr:energy-coupling factor transporter transmembrane component T [Sporanaerobacter sp. PP17-6a]SCL85914.1 putative HMP/thiamine permease protein YkoC [Sporanaerobacter sp. PP17-6a]
MENIAESQKKYLARDRNIGFSSVHPLPCLIYYIGVIIFSMMIKHPLFIFTGLVLTIFINYIGDEGKALKKSLKFYLFIGMMVALINPFISHEGNTTIFYFFSRPITLESVVYGIVMMFSLLIILFVFISFNQIMTNEKILFLFSNISPNTGLIVMMILRFVPLLKDRIQDISLIQEQRGISTKEGKIKKRLENGMKILNVLIAWSLEESIETARSMKGRGYGVVHRRTFYNNYKMDKRDWTVFSMLLFLIFLIIVLHGLGYGKFEIYPKVGYILFNLKDVFLYILFILYMSIPIVLEGTDRLKWNKFR